MPFTDKYGHLTKVFQKEKKHDTAIKSIAERINEQKLESSLIKSLLEQDS